MYGEENRALRDTSIPKEMVSLLSCFSFLKKEIYKLVEKLD